MFITLLEVPVVLLYLLTTAISKLLMRLINIINKHRKTYLDNYAELCYKWDGYEEIKGKYWLIEKDVLRSNILSILAIVIVIFTCIVINWVNCGLI